jgi:hypothetical protein
VAASRFASHHISIIIFTKKGYIWGFQIHANVVDLSQGHPPLFPLTRYRCRMEEIDDQYRFKMTAIYLASFAWCCVVPYLPLASTSPTSSDISKKD